MVSDSYLWWRHGVFYQIYPRSFMDSNGDGVGDLQGIIDRLDYLVELGVDAIWISPIFASPMADFGYDVSDYKGIHPMFGDMATFDRLLSEAHRRGLRIVLDYVPNHSSAEHPWFIESRSSRDNPKREWYIWKDGKSDGGPPNNWESIFGGQAWEWDATTRQYYLHLFLPEQPDLNWRNPQVVQAMHEVLRFWLDKGVDGFRMDAVMLCMKHPDFPDNPPVQDQSAWKRIGLTLEPVYTVNRPEIHPMLRAFRQLLDQYDGDRVMIGETWLFELDELVEYYGGELDEFHIPFNFLGTVQPWESGALQAAISAYYNALPTGAAPNFVFGNHDVHRMATRFGAEHHRSAGMLLLTLKGTPTLYYADELGMQDVDIPPARCVDPWGLNAPDLNIGRDPQRTPMQWDRSPNAGFSPAGIDTWLPVAADYGKVNVAVQRNDPESTLQFYKALLKLRRELPALHRGSFAFVDQTTPGVMAYLREADGRRLLIIINFESKEQQVDYSLLGKTGKLLLSTRFVSPTEVSMSALTLRPCESLLIQLMAHVK
ncbi:MAG: DUF3459 domain-containing protein [Candidatus Marinimicrobia bacterium]|nr:DUF3459 domain-containing protein [Candidatus Neomarinimicrobiota bacterium]